MTSGKKKTKKYKDTKLSNADVLKDAPIARVYKSGNSKVITIPPEVPFKVGDDIALLSTDVDEVILKKVSNRDEKAQDRLRELRKFAGKYEGFVEDDPEKLDLLLEGVYE